jgi:8-oxo-dGTP pyrophosphatase MutT (NUDIX family)
MFGLNLIARAVIVHEGKFLLTVLDDGKRAPFHNLLGGHIKVGEPMIECVVREVREEVGLEVAPLKLLYIMENYFARGSSKLHEIGYYFLCHPLRPIEGELLGQLQADTEELIAPELLTPEELMACNFQPEPLKQYLAADLADRWAHCPRLIVHNELPGHSEAKNANYEL